MNLALLVSSSSTLVHLSPVDLVIIVFYFALVLAIGLYLKGRANTSEDFFLAGREMTAWIAGLSFLSANLGSLELMGWAASAYQYGILAAHWYWIGAIPAMLFLSLVMMPFYYISKTHSVPGYLKLRFGEPSRTLSSISFAFMTVLMSGINMYSMALVMKVILGWNIHTSIWISSITVAIYVALGGLRSAIFNEVLQFILIWAGALLIPILGLIEAGGVAGLRARVTANAGEAYTHLWGTMGSFDANPMGIHWTGIVFGLGAVISFGYWTTDFLVVQRVLAAQNLRAAKMAPIIGAAFKMMVPFIVILPGLLGWAVLPFHLMGESAAVATGGHSYNEVLGQCKCVCHGVDLRYLRSTASPECNRQRVRHDGTLVHNCGRAHKHRHSLPGDAICQHHGLRAGAIQLFHRAIVRDGDPGNAVAACDQGWRILGASRWDPFLDWHVDMGES